MKKTSLMVLLFAATIFCLTSCQKCYFDKAENPSFATLSGYIGMDKTALKAEFEAKGYELNEFQGVIDATKYFDDYTEVYSFNTADNTIIGAEYNYRQSDATNTVIKDAFLTMLEEEKTNPEHPSLDQYDGGYEPMEDDEYVTYSTKDEFITAMKSLDFKDVYKAWSRSTYAGGKKTVVRIEDGWLYYSAGSIKEEL